MELRCFGISGDLVATVTDGASGQAEGAGWNGPRFAAEISRHEPYQERLRDQN